MNWYKKSNLTETLQTMEKAPGLVNFLGSLGFDKDGHPLPQPPVTEERRKKMEKWREEEHEHGSA